MFIDGIEISLKSYSGNHCSDSCSHFIFDTFSRDFLEGKSCGSS